MKIAGFNGFLFHYEMWGYIIHYCKTKGYELTIYTSFDNKNNEGYISLYNLLFSDFPVTYKDCSEFDNEHSNYDCIILFTDDDYVFYYYQQMLSHKTICIDHINQIRSPNLVRHIATRPYYPPYNRDWALPCYPIYNLYCPHNNRTIKDKIDIVIIGDTNRKYDTSIINRIQSINNKKIHLHSVGRITTREKFENLDYNRFDLTTYKDCDASRLITLLQKCNYILIGTTHTEKNYDEGTMNGCIPIAVSTLTPMIVPTQMNNCYNFQNVIIYDRNARETPIILQDINMKSYEEERDKMIYLNHQVFDRHISSIIH